MANHVGITIALLVSTALIRMHFILNTKFRSECFLMCRSSWKAKLRLLNKYKDGINVYADERTDKEQPIGTDTSASDEASKRQACRSQ